MEAVGLTDIGLHRKRNEDSFLIDKKRKLFAVCDGMGGHKGGNVASKLAIDTINEKCDGDLPDAKSLLSSIELANQIIWQKGQTDANLTEMGTTVTAAIIGAEYLEVAHVGDSSLYLMHNGNLKKVTHDHTLAQQMVQDGLCAEDETRANSYKHILTRALGVDKEVQIDIYREKISNGDLILLCSDGLTDMLSDTEIESVLIKEEVLQKSAQDLLEQALKNGGFDNITVVLLRYLK